MFIAQLRILFLLSPELLPLVLERSESCIELDLAVDDGECFVFVAFGVADEWVAEDVVGRIYGGQDVVEWVIVVTAWAHLPITQFMLNLNIIKPILLAKLIEFLANYLLNIAI